MEALERHVVNQDWITVLFVVVLGLLVLAKHSFSQRFHHFMMLFATDKYLIIQGKNPNIFHPFNLLFFAVNMISVGIFAFIGYREFSGENIERPAVIFIRIVTAYAAFVLFKFALEKILANILSLDKQVNYYLFYKLSYRNFIAILLLLPTMFFVYWTSPGTGAFRTVLILILLLNFISLLAVYRKNQQLILNHWFYFILYLCALEIGPYFILYKLITKL